MTYMHTCIGCATPLPKCAHRAAIRAAARGFGIFSLRHRCVHRTPLYADGERVLALMPAWLSRDVPDEEEGDPPMRWFPAVFLRQKGTKAILFIQPNTPDTSGYEIYHTESDGFAKAPLSRVRKMAEVEIVDVTECSQCSSIPSLTKRCPIPRVGFVGGECLWRQMHEAAP